LRILDKYILKSFLSPFLAAFLIVLFVLVMQFLWFAFDDIAGKGIDIFYILKFLAYTSLQVTPTALPIAVLLSSIMALGNLSEKYEMASVKSAGISLKRFIRPLVFLTLIISAINFLFLNNIYPYASLKQRNLLFNMKKQKPSLALIEGSFNTEIPGYSIYSDKKYGEDNNLLKNIKIYDLRGGKKNDICITAKKGQITTQEGSKYMTLNLTDGYYYEDHTASQKSRAKKEQMPASKAKFDSYKVNIDISSFNDNNLDLEKYKTHYLMLSVKQLAHQSDTLKTNYDSYLKNKASNFYNTNNAKELYKKQENLIPQNTKKTVLDNFHLKSQINITKRALAQIKKPIRSIQVFKDSYKTKRKILNLYDFEFHYRLAFSFSCLLLFFIGAPLGSLIRKGGFGLPMVLAILIFVFYFFVNSLGRNIAEESSISATFGGWFASMILLPFAFLLTKRATKGTGLVNFDQFTRPVQQFLHRFKKNNRKGNDR
jgi:lipopolysaccharide export system permease protein